MKIANVFIFVLALHPMGCAQTKEQSVDFMADTLTHFAWHSNMVLRDSDKEHNETCRLYVTVHHATINKKNEGAVEVQFHLGTVDPTSIKVQNIVITDEGNLHMYRVSFETTNMQTTIWTYHLAQNGFEMDMKKPIYESFGDTFDLIDRDHTDRFVKAFRHAVILCGGKPSTF